MENSFNTITNDIFKHFIIKVDLWLYYVLYLHYVRIDVEDGHLLNQIEQEWVAAEDGRSPFIILEENN